MRKFERDEIVIDKRDLAHKIIELADQIQTQFFI